MVAARSTASFPDIYAHLTPKVLPYATSFLSLDLDFFVKAGIHSINAFAVLLLIVICGNVALLMLTRTATREREILVRAALGATRGRILAQLLLEALLLAALAEGRSRIEGPLLAGDALATRGVLAGWGVEVTEGAPGSGGKVAWEVRGRGLRGLVAPQGPLDCGRSGTTLRLAAGIAAGQGHPVTLSGDPQLLARPMGRIRDPLRALGATVEGPGDAARAPLFVHGGALRGGAWIGCGYRE